MIISFKKSISAFAALAAFAGLSAHAEVVKQARTDDVASEYRLEANGDLFRTVNGNLCQVTNNVTDFKVSMHPGDAAMVYFVREGDLHVLNNSTQEYPCPKATKTKIMDEVKKYSVVSNTKTTIVNAALNYYGSFIAWDNVRPVLQLSGISEYLMNTCYGSEGKSFSSYVAFAITYGGHIVKIKGMSPEDSKVDINRVYNDIQQFKALNDVCK